MAASNVAASTWDATTAYISGVRCDCEDNGEYSMLSMSFLAVQVPNVYSLHSDLGEGKPTEPNVTVGEGGLIHVHTPSQ